jgi:hypothetical protein
MSVEKAKFNFEDKFYTAWKTILDSHITTARKTGGPNRFTAKFYGMSKRWIDEELKIIKKLRGLNAMPSERESWEKMIHTMWEDLRKVRTMIENTEEIT